jgi:deazaflavin-dependent oxidoreductase (nitroreductase family)
MKQSPEFNARFCETYRKSSWRVAGKMVLLLTTTGRKSGLPRTTPLQYEKIGEDYYVGASNGSKSDWVRNIQANSLTSVEVKDQRFTADSEIITDRERIADFLQYRLTKHPLMLRLILKMDGCSSNPGRDELMAYAEKLVLVVLHPRQQE